MVRKDIEITPEMIVARVPYDRLAHNAIVAANQAGMENAHSTLMTLSDRASSQAANPDRQPLVPTPAIAEGQAHIARAAEGYAKFWEMIHDQQPVSLAETVLYVGASDAAGPEDAIRLREVLSVLGATEVVESYYPGTQAEIEIWDTALPDLSLRKQNVLNEVRVYPVLKQKDK